MGKESLAAISPDAWTAIGTWVMAVATAALAVVAYTQLQKVVDESKEKKRRQASLVAPLVVDFSVSTTPSANSSRVAVYNGSNLPIYDCAVRLVAWNWRNAGPDDPPLDSLVLPMVRPMSESNPFEISIGLKWDETTPPLFRPPYELRFTDSAGTRWRRMPDGELAEIPAE